MIKKLIAAGAIALCAGAAAPVSAAVTVHTNIVLGLNLCRFQGRDLDTNFDLKAGFAGGGLVSVYPADFFGLQLGVLYSQKGGIFKTELSNGTLRSTLAFSYFDIPLVVKLGYLPRTESGFRVYVLGGASYGLKLSSRLKLDLVQEGLETPVEDAKLGGYKSGTFDGIAGAGFEIAVKGGYLFLEGRYSKSLATISSEGVDHRFAIFSVLAGYSF